jgi:hypothetical protein
VTVPPSQIASPEAGPVSVIVPVRNGRAYLERSLAPLAEALGRHIAELIVVDDASSDGSSEEARRLGARVLVLSERVGPAAARNAGAAAARADAGVYFFVDADVVVHDDVFARIDKAFASPEVQAVFGSYDDRPAAPGAASRYANLRHHVVHQTCAGEAASFWAGCGAVRAAAFRAAGGFDAGLLARSSIEDVELGARLHAGGARVLLDPAMQGKHLKHWPLLELWRTDIGSRALPWARLMVSGRLPKTQLNVRRGERLKAPLAGLFFLFAAAAPFGAGTALPAVATLAAAAAVNRPLVRVLYSAGGWLLAVQGLLLHQVYYVYSTLTVAWCVLEHRLGLAPKAVAPIERTVGDPT